MKRLSKQMRQWLKQRQAKLRKQQSKPDVRQKTSNTVKKLWWDRNIDAPESFRLRENDTHTNLLNFIKDVCTPEKPDEKLRIDFKQTTRVNVDALLLFKANLERELRRKSGGCIKIAPADLSSVNAVLTRVGILELCGQDFHINPSQDKSVLNWELLQGDAKDKLQPEAIHQFLARTLGCNVPKVLFAAVREALLNIKHHAYRQGDGKWWLMTRLHKEDKVFTVVACDLGRGIPNSIKQGEEATQKEIRKKLQALLESLPLGNSVKDSKIIEESMQYGVSRTKKGYRGKGLPKMKEVVELSQATKASISICSDRGCYTQLGGRETPILRDYPNSIGGTVVTWTIPMNVDDVMRSKRESRHDAKYRKGL